MIDSATSLTLSGLRDWLYQRISAVILALYFIFLMAFIACHPQLTFFDWQTLFSHTGMRVFTLFALLSLVIHSWVGIWTVLTDYIKCAALRLILEVLMILALLGFLVWGLMILW
jgi:succinate dehydrogenase / fumarate reductase membrane anchor subunit